MSLRGTIRAKLQETSTIADQLSETGEGKPAVMIGWVKAQRPYLTIRESEAPAGPLPMSGEAMRQAELNIDVWHNGPSGYAAGVLADQIVDALDQAHIPDVVDGRIIYRIRDARSVYLPEPDPQIAHVNVAFTVRFYRAAFVDKLIARG